jgi:hypothetical protein
LELYYSELETEPCLLALIKAAMSNNVISNTMNHYFANSSLIKFKVNNNLPIPAGTQRGDDIDPIRITFNSSKMYGYSQEYAVGIVIHEFVHALIAYDDAMINQYPTQMAEHRHMLDSWLPQLAGALKSVFPTMSDFDAQAITLFGFGDVAHSDWSYFNSKAQAAFGNNFNTTQALQTAEKYQNFSGFPPNQRLGHQPCY